MFQLELFYWWCSGDDFISGFSLDCFDYFTGVSFRTIGV